MMKRLLMMTCMVLGLWLVGCGPRWRVISQAEPNPFVGEKNFVIMPVDFSGLKVGSKTEEEYLSEKKDKTVESFEQDKIDMATNIEENLKKVAKGGGISVKEADGEVDTFIIKPHVGFMEPGFYAVIASAPSHVILTIRIETKDGKLLDEVEMESRTNPSNFGLVAAGSRYRNDGDILGQIAGQYLRHRVAGDD